MRIRLLATTLLIAGTLFSSCAGPERASTPFQPIIYTPSAPLHLTILHSNDTWGYLMPCG